MRFKLLVEAMNGDAATHRELDVLMMRVEDEVHMCEIPDAHLVEETAWYRDARPALQALIVEAARQTAYVGSRPRGPHLKVVSVARPEQVPNARNLAFAPLEIVVENQHTDGSLVRAAVRAFGCDATRSLFAAPVDPPAVTVRQGGGNGEILKMVDSLLDEARRRNREPRVIAITDSDGEWPGDVKAEPARIRAGCAQRNVPCPELNKRAIENYLPDALWDNYAGNDRATKDAVAALKTLNAVQRDYVKLSRTNDPPWDKDNSNVAPVFAGVPDDVFDALTAGSMKGRGENMAALRLDEFAPTFDLASALDARDQGGDLRNVVQQIEDEL